jgi:polar amino acid transport system substrate-binding protein
VKHRALLVGCMFLMIASPCVSAQNSGKKSVGFIGDPWPPWVYGAEGSPPEKGIAVDIIKEIFFRLNGYKPDFMLFSWNSCLKMVRDGDADALILCAYNADRAEYAEYTDEIVRNKAVMVYRKGKLPKWRSLQDLSRIPMGVLAGNDYGTTFDKAVKDFGYSVNDDATSIEQALVMLRSDRFEIFLTTETSAAEAFKSNPKNKEEFEAMVSPFSDGDIYFIAFSRKSKQVALIPSINKIIAQIKAEGIIDKIRGKYLDR